MNLRASSHPEFDAWRWHEYWVPLESVIEFKREVYYLALTELSRFLPKPQGQANRYLRGNMRQGRRDGEPASELAPEAQSSRSQQASKQASQLRSRAMRKP